ncbi:MAG: RtcB family protein [Planctomycetota bacterium]
MTDPAYQLYNSEGDTPIKAWVRGVPIEKEALQQLRNIAQLPFIYKWVAAMPDVHLGIGATVGSVIPTIGAIVPAAVGVDIGCGMMAIKTSLNAKDLPDSLKGIRASIEKAVPHGISKHRGQYDKGSWGHPPERAVEAWKLLEPRYKKIVEKFPSIKNGRDIEQLGTLGGGNHFIELCLDEKDCVWVMLHSGSRGAGNRIGTFFIELAKRDLQKHIKNLPDKDLAYFTEGAEHFDDYVFAVDWAQDFARANRENMMNAILNTLQQNEHLPPFKADLIVVNCHHNYVQREKHFGHNVYITRKGAVRAGAGEWGIIPGSMGTKSYIVRGRGNPESFESCSHGAGRAHSRSEAKRRFTTDDHERATAGIECRKDAGVIDETPMAYKNIDDVMEAQKDLVEIAHTLRQVLVVKG